jgi:hypothetical protein
MKLKPDRTSGVSGKFPVDEGQREGTFTLLTLSFTYLPTTYFPKFYKNHPSIK